MIENNSLYTVDELIEQFMLIVRQQMKRISTAMLAVDYDPVNVNQVHRLLSYLERLKAEIEQHIYINDDETLHRLDVPKGLWKGRLSDMKTISFINLKGGVGKTTISVNVAYAINHAVEDVKILFIDNDKQGNASRWLGADMDKGSITNIMMGDAKASEVIQHTRYPNIDIIPADIGLIEANSYLIKNPNLNQAIILREALKDVSDRYQLCIVDNPPDINVSVLNSLAVTDDVVIVTFPDPDSLSGVYAMAEQIEMIRDLNPALRLKGVLINAFTSDSAVHNAVKNLKAKNLPIFSNHIHYATKAAKKNLNLARQDKKSIFEQYPNCMVARDIWRFTKELLGVK